MDIFSPNTVLLGLASQCFLKCVRLAVCMLPCLPSQGLVSLPALPVSLLHFLLDLLFYFLLHFLLVVCLVLLLVVLVLFLFPFWLLCPPCLRDLLQTLSRFLLLPFHVFDRVAQNTFCIQPLQYFQHFSTFQRFTR